MPLPIRDCIGAALRFAVDNWRFLLIVATLGAAATTLLAAIGGASPVVAIVGMLATGLVRAFVYAALLGCVLFGATNVRARWSVDGLRVWAAMAVIGFFLFILFFVISIPVSIALISGPLTPYLGDLEQAGEDQAQVMAVMLRFMQEHPSTALIVTLFYLVTWLLITSRFYAAAPASVDRQRILTFETWRWTKGHMLRITASRLILLAPAYVLVRALELLLARVLGLPISDTGMVMLVGAAPALVLGYVFVTTALELALYLALEAGLSAAIYRALKPAESQQTP